jgi:hypothetical protein
MDCCQPGRGQHRIAAGQGEAHADVDSPWAALPSSFSEWLGLRASKKETLIYKRPVQLRQERDEAKRRCASPPSLMRPSVLAALCAPIFS